jgi:hypothetical protein
MKTSHTAKRRKSPEQKGQKSITEMQRMSLNYKLTTMKIEAGKRSEKRKATSPTKTKIYCETPI